MRLLRPIGEVRRGEGGRVGFFDVITCGKSGLAPMAEWYVQ